MRRLAIPSSAVLLFTFVLVTPALAAAPGNDLYAGRTSIAALPFSETIDTTEATTDADDAELNLQCGAPATDASVWYELTATDDVAVMVDVTASDYTAGVIVASGAPGSFVVEACGPGIVGFFALSGETYTILAFDDTPDASNGGTLSITVGEAPPPPSIDITVDPIGSFDPQTGSATISGTATCSSDALFAFIELELRQQVGRFIVTGYGATEVVCDDTTQPWSVEVFGSNGLFKGGRAVSVTFGTACGSFDCGSDFEEATVHLRR